MKGVELAAAIVGLVLALTAMWGTALGWISNDVAYILLGGVVLSVGVAFFYGQRRKKG